MRLFIDSSALAKRYVSEPGTDAVLRRCLEADEIVLSVLCAPELISAFNRLHREKKISASAYRRLKDDLAADLAQATIVDLTPSVVNRTVFCLEREPFRALDAVQVASAMEFLCDLFITADRRQSAAATRLKLKTENVGDLS
jgi:predicted nucleic acid-binding protein